MERRGLLWIGLVCAVAIATVAWLMTRPTPARAADRFVKAVSERDSETAGKLLTQKGREHWGDGARASGRPTIDIEQADHVIGKDARVEGTESSGDNAVVTCRSGEGTGSRTVRLSLKREEGEWRVASVRVTAPNGEEQVALDFEDPATFLSSLVDRLKKAVDPAVLGDTLGRAGRAIRELGSGVERAGDALAAPKPTAP